MKKISKIIVMAFIVVVTILTIITTKERLDARKQQEALKLYNKQYSEEELQALFERNKMYLEKISVLV